ncbi:MAG: hypothetical protein LIO71_07700, partial [Ruminococcus sp.]|nr:hypothetical protein [Ruminococcus sp.]
YKKSQNGLTSAQNGGNIENTIKISMQFFAEKDLKNQNSNTLKRSIKSFEKRIIEHKEKISNPKKYYPNWDTFDERYQNGLKKHWKKEISNFEQSIQNRIEELKNRGDFDE